MLTVDFTNMQKHSKTNADLFQYSSGAREFDQRMHRYHAMIAILLAANFIGWISGILIFATNA